jgi:signal transduction histidine kinase
MQARWSLSHPVRTVLDVFSEILRPWRQASTWWGLVHAVLDMFVGTFTFTVVVVLASVTFGMLFTLIFWVPFLWVLFVTGRAIGHVERSRFAALLGVDLRDPVPPLRSKGFFRRLFERVSCWPRWRELGYGVLLLPLGLFTSMVALIAWCGAAALITLPAYAWALPDHTAHFGLFEVHAGVGVFLVSAVGVLLMLAAPWVSNALVALDTRVARWLLAPRRDDELGERVTQLETSRTAAVDSAESERRRIERDLHDGAQQRLVALAMGLGAARERLDTDPERGRELVAEAHEEAKAALKEIRDLVRGIHPVILEDRGLDAALSAVVARSPIPVTLEVDVPERPSPVVESAAYFVVAEALTNVARHAGAKRAFVTIVRAGSRLVVEVRDDGRGGADADKGSGLAGLRNRVAALDGTMHVVSPEGGPTTLLVEMPCGS